MTNKFDTADDWIDGDVLYSADLIDTYVRIGWVRHITSGDNTDLTGAQCILGHADDTYSVAIAGNIFNTTNNATSWTSKNTDLETAPLIGRVCKANRAYGIV